MIEYLQPQGTLFLVGFSFVFGVIIWMINRLQRTLPSPVNKLIVRWLRLLLIGGYLAVVFKFTFFSGIPYWRLFAMGILGWFLFDSGYLWLYILAWDKSELPLFPSIRQVESVDWPANRRFFLIKDWIRANKYSEIGCFKYFFEEEVLQQTIVYESADGFVRLQVIIVADVSGVILDQVIFTSELEDGKLLVTDNVFMPYGGIYPESWCVRRFPAIRKIDTIAKRHMEVLEKDATGDSVKFELDAKDWMTDLQNVLERENISGGILNSRRDRQVYGKMTGEGRYRIWMELLLLNYFSHSSLGK